MSLRFSQQYGMVFRMLIAVLFWGVGTTAQAAQPDVGLGKIIYNAKCAACHGEDGKGDGVEAALLFPKPRNYTSGIYKFRSTETGSIPTDDDLARTISEGLQGTSMPAWKKWITRDSLNAVIAYIKTFSPKFQTETAAIAKVTSKLMSITPNLAKGKSAYSQLQCASCHGEDGKGTGAVASDLQDTWGHPIAVSNLTEPWTFRRGSSPQEVFLRLRTGIDGTPMPSYVGSASDEEMWHLAHYVLSLARKPIWKMTGEEVAQHYTQLAELDKKAAVKRGEYLVKSMGCADCHSPIDEKGNHFRELMYAGGQRWSLGPYGEFVTYNLTSDKETGLGNWSDDQLKTFITTGVRRNGTRMLPFPMPWTAFANLKRDDLNAIVAYLRTIPPVSNKIPEPNPKGFFAYMWGKFKMMILKEDFPGYVYPGNAGQTNVQPVAQARETRQ